MVDVLPHSGGDITKPRWPLPIGATRSMTRAVDFLPRRLQAVMIVGVNGFEVFESGRSRLSPGSAPLISSICTSAGFFSFLAAGRLAPLTMSPLRSPWVLTCFAATYTSSLEGNGPVVRRNPYPSSRRSKIPSHGTGSPCQLSSRSRSVHGDGDGGYRVHRYSRHHLPAVWVLLAQVLDRLRRGCLQQRRDPSWGILSRIESSISGVRRTLRVVPRPGGRPVQQTGRSECRR